MESEVKIRPVEFKILVRVEEIEQKIGSIIIPDTTRERERIAQESGVIVAMGERACSEPEIWGGNPPKVGDRVLFSKYAGAVIKKLGKDYRLIQDKDLGAVIEE